MRPREFILHPWLTIQNIALIHGQRGIGKSYLALSIAVAVACGQKFLNWEMLKPRGVLYVDGVMPDNVIQSRLHGILNEKELKAPLRIISRNTQGATIPDISTARGQKLLEPHLEDISLIIFDSLLTLCPAVNEYDQESWKPLERWLLSLKHRGFSILFLHQTSSHGRMRGSSRLEDIMDSIINLKRPYKYKSCDGAHFVITFDKSVHCYGDDIKSFSVMLNTDYKGRQEWGTKDSKKRKSLDSMD